MNTKKKIFSNNTDLNFSQYLKNKNGIVLVKSDHPKYLYEAYDWQGIFLSYLGNKK